VADDEPLGGAPPLGWARNGDHHIGHLVTHESTARPVSRASHQAAEVPLDLLAAPITMAESVEVTTFTEEFGHHGQLSSIAEVVVGCHQFGDLGSGDHLVNILRRFL
jgi:hypothetical protein